MGFLEMKQAVQEALCPCQLTIGVGERKYWLSGQAELCTKNFLRNAEFSCLPSKDTSWIENLRTLSPSLAFRGLLCDSTVSKDFETGKRMKNKLVI